ncbi:MAG: DUF58 domain-containing protein [Candidatus Methanosuratincola petrocarbonis]
MEVSFTKRGVSAAMVGAFLATLGGCSGDPVLAAAGIGGMICTVGDFAVSMRRGRSGQEMRATGEAVSEGSSGLSVTSIAGETVELSVEVRLPLGVGRVESFEAGNEPFEVTGHTETQLGYSVDIRARPEVYGEYVLGEIYARSRSKLGLFSVRKRLVPEHKEGMEKENRTNRESRKNSCAGHEKAWIVRVKVYPRFYPLMIEVLSLLGEGVDSDVGASAAKKRRIGRGMDYAWSREYEPWDSPRFIDWKATARRGRLSVKEFFEDLAGRGVLVFFDGRAPGRQSADEMARDLLSAALGLAGTGQRATMVLSQGGSHRVVEGTGEDVLRASLAAVFESVSEADPDVFALFPPAVESSLLRIVRKERGGVEAGAIKGGVGQDAYDAALRLVRRGHGDLVYIGCPLHDAAKSIRLISEAASRGARVSTFLPTKPWLDARSLEEAYEWRVSWIKILETFERATTSARAVLVIP